jgi:hypothetical protein
MLDGPVRRALQEGVYCIDIIEVLSRLSFLYVVCVVLKLYIVLFFFDLTLQFLSFRRLLLHCLQHVGHGALGGRKPVRECFPIS